MPSASTNPRCVFAIRLAALLIAAGAPVGTAPAADALWPDLQVGSTAPGTEGSRDAALLIAIEDYAWLPDVRGARANADAWLRWLTATRGVPLNAVTRLYDADAKDIGIRAAVERARAAVKPGGTLWVVFVGHGAPARDGRDGLLVGVDADRSAAGIYGRSVARNELLELASTGRQAHTVVVLDACFSGQGVDGAPLVDGLQPVIPVEAFDTGAEATVLTAAGSGQFAGPLPGTSRPAFSYLALGALRGWGDADHDGVVTAAEVTSYAAGVLNVTVSGRTQTPLMSGADFGLARGKEPGPDVLGIASRLSAVPVQVVGGTSGGFSDLRIDVSAELAEQGCQEAARKAGTSARAQRLADGATKLQAEARAGWAELEPQANQCLAVADAATRAKCAATVGEFITRAEASKATLPAGRESSPTACGVRTVAFAEQTASVELKAEIGRAKSVKERLGAPASGAVAAPASSTAAPASTASSGVSPVVIDTMMRSNKGVKTCFITEKNETGTLPQAVKVKFTLQPSGTVSTSAVTGGTWGSEGFPDCLAGAVREIHFPAFEGAAVTLTYPFKI